MASSFSKDYSTVICSYKDRSYSRSYIRRVYCYSTSGDGGIVVVPRTTYVSSQKVPLYFSEIIQFNIGIGSKKTKINKVDIK